MSRNDPTVIINWDEPAPADEEEAVDVLTKAYAELGKAFYEYRFEEPTPELLLLFDKITAIRNANKDAEAYEEKKQEHIEQMNYYEQVSVHSSLPVEDYPDSSNSQFLSSLDDLPDITERQSEYLGNNQQIHSSLEARFCSNCGTPAEPDSIFCGNCGSRLD